MATSVQKTRYTLRFFERLRGTFIANRSHASKSNTSRCVSHSQQERPNYINDKQAGLLHRNICQAYSTETPVVVDKGRPSVVENKEQSSLVVEDSDEPDILYKQITLEVKGHDPQVLKSYEQFVKQTSGHLELELDKVLTPKVHIYRQALLKSAHIYKKHQVQYEQRTYFKVFKFERLTGSTADTLLEYLQRNLPEGVAMKVTKHQVLPMPPHLRPPTVTRTKDSTF